MFGNQIPSARCTFFVPGGAERTIVCNEVRRHSGAVSFITKDFDILQCSCNAPKSKRPFARFFFFVHLSIIHGAFKTKNLLSIKVTVKVKKRI